MNIHGEILRCERLKHGWTQEQLATIADISVRTVQRAEREGAASLETINALCVSLSVTLEDLQVTSLIEGATICDVLEKDITQNTLGIIFISVVIGGLFGFLCSVYFG